MNTCKDCKHWAFENYAVALPEYAYGACEHPKVGVDRTGADSLSVHSDSGGGSYGFSTGEDFGCVHWEP